MTIKELKLAIAKMPDEWPVYFRRVAPVLGNIEEAGSIRADRYAFFGSEYPCAIVEPFEDPYNHTTP